MNKISRRNALKSGLVIASSAAAGYYFAQSSIQTTEAMEHGEPQFRIFLEGSREIYGVSVEKYDVEFNLNRITAERITESETSDPNLLIGQVLSYSRRGGDEVPAPNSYEVEMELGYVDIERMLNQQIYHDETVRKLLSQAEQMYWVRINPWILVGNLGRTAAFILAPIALGYLDDLGRSINQDVYPVFKAWFLEKLDR